MTTVQSGAEAGPPPVPSYSRNLPDSVTGVLPPVVVTGTSANCPPNAPCFIAEPNNPSGTVDSYYHDVYERPAGQGSAAASYYPSIDIASADTGVKPTWVFYRLNLVGPEAGQLPGSPASLPYFYSVEVNFDDDPQGDVIVELAAPSATLGTDWSTAGLIVRADLNETLGGPRPLLADGPGQAGGGYEHKVFDSGQNTAPGMQGGATAIQARVTGSSIEIAIFRPFLESLTTDVVTGAGFRPYAARSSVNPSKLYIHDDRNRGGTGSPYPWLEVAGAPSVCPGGSSGDNGVTPAQRASLESGTRVNTGIPNPCYAVGSLYELDNAGTIASLANKDDVVFDIDLKLAKSDSPDPVTVGGLLTYTLTVTNATPGTGQATNVVVVDTLPPSVSFVNASPGCTHLAGVVTCMIGTMANGTTTAVTITVIPTVAGTITNTAAVTSDGDEIAPLDNVDSEPTTVNAMPPACGNGNVDPGEACDDGNQTPNDGCELDCKKSDGQSCTDDGQCASGICDNGTCEPANSCGNGVLEGTEVCDDGNTADGDGCDADCKKSDGETCTGDDQCSSGICDNGTCEPANTCGNGVVEGTEACDDGNTSGGDGCSAACLKENGETCTGDTQCESGICDNGTCEPANTCGNGVVETGETCDDGNTTAGDGCEATCKLSDGEQCTGDEQCDSEICHGGTCQPNNQCGNSVVESGEACDDGNTSGGDGCSATCLKEDGETCTDDPECQSGICDNGICEPADVCGNSVVESGEACDDGNTVAGDGCSATCLKEDGQPCDDDTQCQSGECAGEPQVCGGTDTDRDGVRDIYDLDDDNDGLLDTIEGAPARDTDGDGALDAIDLDSDNDGIGDAVEAGHASFDGNGDYFADCASVGANGFCDALETAAESGVPAFGARDHDGDGVVDYLDLDSDNDGIADLHEGGSGCYDLNDNGVCDMPDVDRDGIVDVIDFVDATFGNVGALPPTDIDADGTPDYHDLDSDNDLLWDVAESKHASLDATGDGVIDAVGDGDDDGVRDVADDSDLDGTADDVDPDPKAFAGLRDSRLYTDTDGVPDHQDPDGDGDGVVGGDNCPTVHNPDQSDIDGDGIGDACDDSDDAWGVAGGGCGCATSSGGSSSIVLGFAMLWLLTTRRRRPQLVALLAAVVALPRAASAQVIEGELAVERFQIASDADGILDVESGRVREHLQLDLSLWLGYANDPLTVYRPLPDGRDRFGSLVSNQIGGELTGVIGVFGRFQGGLAMPLVFSQEDDLDGGTTMPDAPGSSFAVGDLRLILKGQLLEQSRHAVDLAAVAAITFPTSSGDGFVGDSFLTFAPMLAVSRDFGHGLRGAANVGYRAREQQMAINLEVNDEVFGAAAIGYDLRQHAGPALELELGFAFATAAGDAFGEFNRNYAEIKPGASLDIDGPLIAFVASGFGVAEGFGTPDWRFLAGVRVDREDKPAPPAIADTDKDGLLDPDDKCVTEPEDKDAFEDSDGCPDLDDDKDGIPDTSDGCRLEPEDKDAFEDENGCPETDNDQDKIVDTSDSCPLEPEDHDGFEDDNGCPETDNDKDTVLDADDGCPLVAGAVDNKGCPWPDRDNDGVIDRLDNCPDWAGKAEFHGCNGPQLVRLTEGKIELLEVIQFATNRTAIQRKSFKVLDAAALVIKNHPDLRIEIEGHTDDRGSDTFNLKLSDGRAAAVRKYFVKKGVPAERLSSKGHGEAQPIADNKTWKGRAQNRRVELLIVRDVETTVPVQPTAPATPAPKRSR